MVVYKITASIDGYKVLDLSRAGITDIISNMTLDSLVELENRVVYWAPDSLSEKTSECPFIIGAIPVLSERLYSLLKPLLCSADVLTIPIQIGDNNAVLRYFLLVAPKRAGLVDKDESDIRYYRDGRIMNIKKFSFKGLVDRPIFRVEEQPIFTFVSEEIASILKKEVNEIILTPCEVH